MASRLIAAQSPAGNSMPHAISSLSYTQNGSTNDPSNAHGLPLIHRVSDTPVSVPNCSIPGKSPQEESDIPSILSEEMGNFGETPSHQRCALHNPRPSGAAKRGAFAAGISDFRFQQSYCCSQIGTAPTKCVSPGWCPMNVHRPWAIVSQVSFIPSVRKAGMIEPT